MNAPTSSPPAPARNAFSILELLVVIAILGLLAGLVLPALKATRESAAKTKELAAARQLMLAFAAYAQDNRGAVIPGIGISELDLPATNAEGEPIYDLPLGPIMAARYPWRLAPYLDWDLRGLVFDESALDELRHGSRPEYLLSLVPSLGMNVSFVGGDYGGLAAPSMQSQFGKVFVSRLSEPRHPQRLMVFASARVDRDTLNQPLPGTREIIEGYFEVEAPFLLSRQWVEAYAEAGLPSDWGHVSLRHGNRAVAGFFDGHTDTLDEARSQDMRHWCDKADRPDWTLEPLSRP